MKHTIIRIITGLIIIGAGVGALLNTMDVFPFWSYFKEWWPLGLIIASVLMLVSNARNFIWSIALFTIGLLLILNNLDITDVNLFSLILPVIIIAVGLSVLINKTTKPRSASTADEDNIAAIFGGLENSNKSSDYQGGKVSAFFGGVSLDLRDAKIKKEATLNVSTLCGGIEIKVPREWRVQSNVFPILGGIENKSEGSKDSKSPVLIITGNIMLGGVEIKT